MKWNQMIHDLQAAGMTQVAIGESIGKSQPWVSDVLSGKCTRLKWEDAEALRRLHAERVQKEAA